MKLFKRLFKRKMKSYLLENKHRVVEAFELNGVKYFMYDNTSEVPTGRMLAALAIYTELEMKVDKEYLELHTRAMEKLLSDPKKINVMYIAQLNLNLKERLELMPLPDFVYKLASVIFFDKTESPYSYSFDYNKAKIAEWKKSGDTLDFFLSRLSSELIPSLKPATGSTRTFFQVAEQVAGIHLTDLTKILSANQ
jgi:hypothetical protein